MNPALWAALGAAVALLLVLLGFAVAAITVGRHARAAEEAARGDVEALRARLEELSAELAASRGAAAAVPVQAEYVITTAGEGEDTSRPAQSERATLGLTLGEPLVKVAAFGYGLRRALAPETRNRIAFEMRREVRRARKQRRRAARRTRLSTPAAEENAA
ncbi:MAG TPA: hypothetical protein VFZ64_10800 [Nocardioidaceae bacterium]